MKELNDELIVFPFELRRYKADSDEEIDPLPKIQFGDVITSVRNQETGIDSERLENAFDRYGISPKVERAKKHFAKNKKGKGR